MIPRDMEEDIRRIVREEIAHDEMRRIENERPPEERFPPAPATAVPGVQPPPGTVFLSRESGLADDGEAYRAMEAVHR